MLKAWPYIVVAVAVLLPVRSVPAQTIQGRLLDATSDEPVASGTVALLTEAGEVVATARSEGSGCFLLSASVDSAGEFLLSAQALGYRNATDGPFRLGPSDSITVEFRIPREPVVVDSLRVEVPGGGVSGEQDLVRNGFADRMRSGLGEFLAPADLDRMYVEDVAGYFERMQGVNVSYEFGNDQILMRRAGRRCIPDIYLDGLRTPVQGNLDQLGLTPGDVEAIEAFRRPAEAPLEYGGGDRGGCGIVLIWTEP